MKKLALFTSELLLGLIGFIFFTSALPAYAQNGGITFAAGPNLFTARMAHASTPLPDGRVALFGGHGTDFVPLQSAEIWNPETNMYTLYQMNYTHDVGAIARLQDGRFLLAGGASDAYGVGYSIHAEVFDPTNNSFTVTGNMQYARTSNSAATLTSGKVLVAGCWYNPTSAAYGDLFDPTTNTFTATGGLNTGRANPRVLPTTDGQAVVFGGMNPYGGSYVEQVELYDPVANSFSILQDTLIAAEPGWITLGSVGDTNGNANEAQQLPDGRYLFLASNMNTSTYALFTFDPATKNFSKISTSPPLPSSGVALLTPVVHSSQNTVYILAYTTPLPSTLPIQTLVYRLNLASGVVSAPSGTTSLDGYLGNVGLNILPDGRLFITGGTTVNDYYYNFYPSRLTFTGSLTHSLPITPVTMLLLN